MLTKSQIQFVRSLHDKSIRTEEKLFIAEGIKTVRDLLPHFTLHSSYALSEEDCEGATIVSEKELGRLSLLKQPQKVLAVFHQTQPTLPTTFPKNTWVMALDHIADPGNLGTIIRIADWFGIDHILCSHDTVEQWNPKVVQATMGSLARVQLSYVDLDHVLPTLNLPILAATLGGNSLQETSSLPTEGIILLGNESLGVSPSLQKIASHLVQIPSFSHERSVEGAAESLNVATAAAILTYVLRSR